MTTKTTAEYLQTRLIRYDDLIPCKNAFVDTRTPGSDQKENFTLIGPGVSENPNQHVHIPEAHGFNIGGARQPPGCLNSQHSHLTAEVFAVHSGKWRFLFGVDANDGFVDLAEGDVINIPTNMFRGFENIGEDTGFLFAVLGGDDPGKVEWSPSVYELAEKYGLVLLEGGRLIDTTQGETVPEGAQLSKAASDEVLAALQTPPTDKLMGCVVRCSDITANPRSALQGTGVSESAIITPQSTGDGFDIGPAANWWQLGFNLRRLDMQADAHSVWHHRHESEVIFVQQGSLNVDWKTDDESGSIRMHRGDCFSVPPQLIHRFSTDSTETSAFIVRGGDSPAQPIIH